jgi:hypothetical protein
MQPYFVLRLYLILWPRRRRETGAKTFAQKGRVTARSARKRGEDPGKFNRSSGQLQGMHRAHAIGRHVCRTSPSDLVSAAAGLSAADAVDEAFSVVDDSYDDPFGRTVQVKQLRNNATGELVEVLLNTPGYDEANPAARNRSAGSGSVNGLLLLSKASGELREVQPHRTGFAGGLMAPFANRVRGGRYTFQGQELQLAQNWNEKETRMTRSGDHAIHGLLPEELRVAAWQSTESAASLTLEAEFDGTDQGYPFEVKLSFTYTLDPTGFRIDVKAVNVSSEKSAPFMVGWHPWFNVTDVSAAVIELDPATKYNMSEPTSAPQASRDSVPTGVGIRESHQTSMHA